MCIDDFDFGQSDDYVIDGDYINDDEIVEILAGSVNSNMELMKNRHPVTNRAKSLTKEDYADIFLENFN